MALSELFAELLKHYREAVALSQEELAAKAGLDRTFISQLERGLKSPTLKSVEKLAHCLGVEAEMLIRARRRDDGPAIPDDYFVRPTTNVVVVRGNDRIDIPSLSLTSAINETHDMIDDLYAAELDIATTLGMRNLSAFIGELVAAAVLKTADGLFEKNPHQDGYPDLLLMDKTGKRQWQQLSNRLREKNPFSPFLGGGIEVKATCGSVPSPAQCERRNILKPGLGDTRIECLTGYDWKAHHRDTNNLLGILWDFINEKPRVVAMFFSSALGQEDWGKIVQPRAGGGRTTSVSILGRAGVKKMYDGWLCVIRKGGYAKFLNQRNSATSIPVDDGE